MKPDSFEKMARKAVREALSQYEIHGINVMDWLKIIAELPLNIRLIDANDLKETIKSCGGYLPEEKVSFCDEIDNAKTIIEVRYNGNTDIDPTAETQA